MKDMVAIRDRFAPAPRIDVIVRKEDVDGSRVEGKAAIVIDILFATTTIVTALEAGASSVYFAVDQHEARQIAATLPAGEFNIAGDDHLAAIPGFSSPLPLELSRQPGFAGKPLVYSTTNGTVALRRSKGAAAIYAASLRNASATLAHVAAYNGGMPLVIVCAGSAGRLNLEDFYGAGYFVEVLSRTLDDARDFSDTALAARATFRSTDAWSALAASRVGRIVRGAGADEEIRHSSEIDASSLVAIVDASTGDRVIRSQ